MLQMLLKRQKSYHKPTFKKCMAINRDAGANKGQGGRNLERASLAPRYLSDLFVRISGVHPSELRNSKTDLSIPMLRTGNSQKSFAYHVASLWNRLDFENKMTPSINAFRSKLKEK